MRNLGLNTEDSILIKGKEYFDRLNEFVKDLDAVSIRTVNPKSDVGLTPHYPYVERSEIVVSVEKLLAGGYWPIVAKPIHPRDALLAGTIMRAESIYTVELAQGPYTTRRVTHEGKIDISITIDTHGSIESTGQMSDETHTHIASMMSALSSLKLRNYIAEISYYSIPVGWRNQPVIIWELTDNGSGTFSDDVARLLDE